MQLQSAALSVDTEKNEREAIKCQQSLRIFDAMDALYRVGQYFLKSRNGISVGNSNLLSAYMGHNAFAAISNPIPTKSYSSLGQQTGISITKSNIFETKNTYLRGFSAQM